MTQFFNIGPNPKWYFVNKNGKPLSGGQFNTFSSLNKSLRKPVYSEPNINFPFPNPFPIDADGTAGPFWFLFDDAAPTDGYFIEVTDANGVLIWTVDNYFANGSGGGGNVTVGLNLENLIINDVFWRHCDSIITQVPVSSVIAPSNSANLLANPLAPNGVNPGSDILFLKDTVGVGDADAITFPLFNLGSDSQINTADTTPVDFFNYTCTVPNAGQMVKCLQFPITAKIQNLSNKTVVGSLWTLASVIPNQQIKLRWLSYFGDGAGATIPTYTDITTFTLLNLGIWEKQTFSTTVPDAGAVGNTLGAPEFSGPNDALFLQIQFQDPPTTPCNIGLTKPTLYIGTTLPDLDFQSYDEIDTYISKPRTGDVRISHNTFAPFGWVFCNDGVLSKSSIGIIVTPPAGIPIARANYDTYPLYALIWAIVKANPTFSALFNPAGTAIVPFGAFAIDDFQVGNQLVLTRALGRAIASQGIPSIINSTTGVVTNLPGGTNGIDGQSFGNAQYTLVANDLPTHVHPGAAGQSFICTGTGGNNIGNGTQGTSVQGNTGANVTTNQPVNLMQPTSFYNVFLKL